jgi:hypothetical protein
MSSELDEWRRNCTEKKRVGVGLIKKEQRNRGSRTRNEKREKERRGRMWQNNKGIFKGDESIANK